MPVACEDCVYLAQEADLCALAYRTHGRLLKLPADRSCVCGLPREEGEA